jgi:malate dehydrogenase (oxaloacetate-decarboxylating)(NADP+)
MVLVLLLKLVQIYLKASGVKNENIIMCDSKGVIYKGRENIDQFKSAHAIETKLELLEKQ